MPASITVWPYGQLELNGDLVDWVNDTIKVLLLQNTYTYDATDRYVADLTPATHEHDGGGYARVTVGSASLALRADGVGVKFDSDDVVFSSLAAGTADIRYAAFYRHVGGDADSKLLFIVDFGSDQTPNGSDFQVIAPSNGWLETENRVGPDAVTSVDQNSAGGQKVLYVASTANMLTGATVLMDHKDAGGRREFGVIDTISAGVSITLLGNLTYTHNAVDADPVTVWN